MVTQIRGRIQYQALPPPSTLRFVPCVFFDEKTLVQSLASLVDSRLIAVYQSRTARGYIIHQVPGIHIYTYHSEPKCKQLLYINV